MINFAVRRNEIASLIRKPLVAEFIPAHPYQSGASGRFRGVMAGDHAEMSRPPPSWLRTVTVTPCGTPIPLSRGQVPQSRCRGDRCPESCCRGGRLSGIPLQPGGACPESRSRRETRVRIYHHMTHYATATAVDDAEERSLPEDKAPLSGTPSSKGLFSSTRRSTHVPAKCRYAQFTSSPTTPASLLTTVGCSERKRAPRRSPPRRGGGSRRGSKPAERSEALARRETLRRSLPLARPARM